ncbi:MAG: hypothetical protein OSA48_00830 [Akkermansiaceae bacterium]|nr:hypothetical protein [Akkermansiaceae bacterium]
MKRWLMWFGVVLLSLGVMAQEEAAPVEEAVKESEEKPEESAEEEKSEEEKEDEILEWPTLPEWSEGDLEKLKTGEIVPGRELLKELTGELTLPPLPETPEEELPPEPDPEEEVVEVDPTVIEEQFLEPYFGRTPASFLIDPQETLARQEYRDRESFLAHHAGDSEVNLYVYLFDAEQQLPEGATIETVFDEHHARSGPTAVVFYFLGRPERSLIALSESIRTVVSQEDRERALRVSIQEAYEKSDPSHQLENFSVELSIRLYWFEKAMAIPGGVEPEEDEALTANETLPPITLPMPESEALKLLTKSLWAVIVVVFTVVITWVGRLIARRRLRHVFPEVEIEPMLGAPHAAGVGAVVSFSSSQLPPSQQRDQVPDYLQRM